MKKKSLKVDPEITLPCCGCSGTVIFAAPKPDPKDRPTFFHTMPYCKRFDETNTVDGILQYMRDCFDKKESARQN